MTWAALQCVCTWTCTCASEPKSRNPVLEGSWALPTPAPLPLAVVLRVLWLGVQPTGWAPSLDEVPSCVSGIHTLTVIQSVLTSGSSVTSHTLPLTKSHSRVPTLFPAPALCPETDGALFLACRSLLIQRGADN